MKNIFTAIIIFFLLENISPAQTDFEFEGYFQNLPVFQFVPSELSSLYGVNKNIQLNLSRLELSLSFIWEKTAESISKPNRTFYFTKN